MNTLALVLTLLFAHATPSVDAPSWNAADTTTPLDGEHWVTLADALYGAERYREAVAAYERAIQLGALRPADGAWKVARSYSQLGNAKQAARWVELARRARMVESRATSGDEDRRSRHWRGVAS